VIIQTGYTSDNVGAQGRVPVCPQEQVCFRTGKTELIIDLGASFTKKPLIFIHWRHVILL